MIKKTTFFFIINFALLIGSIFLLSCEKISSSDDIIGTWQGDYLGTEVIITFNFDGTCNLNITDSTTSVTQLLNGNFVIDISKKPMTLSIRNIPQIDYPLHTIAEFIDKKSIKLGRFAPRWKIRETFFDQSHTIILNKIDSN